MLFSKQRSKKNQQALYHYLFITPSSPAQTVYKTRARTHFMGHSETSL